MSEIEKAMEILEKRKMWFDNALSRSLSHDTYEHCKESQSAYASAIQALREKQEREKGCEMCNSDIPMIFDTFTGMDGNPAKFCPNCGRKL